MYLMRIGQAGRETGQAVPAQFVVLEPGDLINTGTPPGVGMGLVPPVWLQVGDVMDLAIDGLGRRRQTIIAPR